MAFSKQQLLMGIGVVTLMRKETVILDTLLKLAFNYHRGPLLPMKKKSLLLGGPYLTAGYTKQTNKNQVETGYAKSIFSGWKKINCRLLLEIECLKTDISVA